MRIDRGGIVFFDSGIGGLTVLHECIKRIPNETFYYYGDNMHAPYGNLTDREIRRNVFRAFQKIERLRPKAAVLACNTATAVCVEDLRKTYDFPVIGTEPALLLGARQTGEILVLATRATCVSERVRLLKEKAERTFPSSKIILQPCPELAKAIEQHAFDPHFDFASLLPNARPSAVVLGCTHYVFIKTLIRAHYGCPIFDGNEGVARRLQSVLFSSEMQNTGADSVFSDARLKLFENMRPLVTPTKTSEKFPQIYFLGRAKRYNKHIFEQMFVNPFK